MTSRRTRCLAIAALLLVACTAPIAAQRPATPPADLVLRHGKVFTADTTAPWAQAVAIRKDRIVFVGADSGVQRLIGPRTRTIDLAGRTVIPGINDAHDHLGGDAAPGVSFRSSVSPTPDDPLSVVLDSIGAITRRAPAGTWITAQVGITVLNDTMARRAALDRVAPTHPVMLVGWWGHGMLLNTAAMRTLGIAGQAADPLGGWYERDAGGQLTGRLDEYAGWDALRRIYSSMTVPALVAGLRATASEELRLGITSVQDMAGYLTPAKTLTAFRAAALPQRIRIIRWPIANAAGRNEREWDGVATHVTPLVSVSGRKWVLDATPIDQYALTRRPYPNRPGWYGRLNFPADTMRAMLAEALRPGAAQLHVHITGDSTLQRVFSMMGELAPDSVWRTRRVRIEHGNGIAGPNVARARDMGIVIGQPRQNSAPLRTWFAAGIPVAFGSDGLRNPFVYLMAAVAPARDSAQAITREQAVLMLTRNGAFAEFAEREKGTLSVGMLADLAVLSQDIFAVPVRALPATTSVLTVVGGRVVHEVPLLP